MTFFKKMSDQAGKITKRVSVGIRSWKLNREANIQQRILNETYRELGERVLTEKLFEQMEGADGYKMRIDTCRKKMRKTIEEMEDLKEELDK